MRQRAAVVSIMVVSVACLAGCDYVKGLMGGAKSTVKPDQTYAVRGTVIAKVNNMPVTLEQLNKEIDLYNASVEYAQLPEEQKKEAMIDNREKKLGYLKDVMIRQMMFYQAALDRGLDRRDDMIEILQRDRVAILARQVQLEIAKDINVSAAEIEEAYKSIKDQLKEPETRKVREMVSSSEADAKQVMIELLQGSDFASIARARSIAASKDNGGDLGYIPLGSKGQEFPGFDTTAFSPALGTGDISSVFKGPGGYYIIKVEGIKEGRQLSLDEVSDRIKDLILSRKQKEALDQAYADIALKIKLEYFEGEIK